MILRDKVKQDFENWIINNPDNHDSKRLVKIYNQKELFVSYVGIGKTFFNALIIEWLDSIGIYIEVGGAIYRGVEFWYNIQQQNTINGHNGEYFNSRQEATEKAIDKANEIYNSL